VQLGNDLWIAPESSRAEVQHGLDQVVDLLESRRDVGLVALLTTASAARLRLRIPAFEGFDLDEADVGLGLCVGLFGGSLHADHVARDEFVVLKLSSIWWLA
jgi:hypothetical protein